MISKELKAQAQLAWSNWKMRNPHTSIGISEEDFVGRFEELQQLHNKGLISQDDMAQRMAELLSEPPVAANVTQFQAPQRPTDDLLRELQDLKKAGVLNDEEFEERKAELFFQRNVTPEDDNPAAPGDDAARQERFRGMLDELHREGILSREEFQSASARLNA
ncbi:MAG: SHOCT domain-containing protein [Bacteroidota bacterium]